MSFPALSWAVRQKLPSTQKLVLLMLAERHNKDSGQCNPSLELLADDCGLSRRSVIDQIAKLQKAGYLTVRHRAKDKLKLPSQYVLHLSAGTPERVKTDVEDPFLMPEKVVNQLHQGSEPVAPVVVNDLHEVVNQLHQGSEPVAHKPGIEPGKEQEIPLLSASKLPDCPHVEIIDLFGQHLAELPQPKPELWDGQRAKNLAARWKWCLTAKKRNGDRYATDKASALSFLGRYFGYVAKSDFLMGRNGQWGGCDLAWLVKADNFAKVLQGNYENKEAA